MVNQFKKSVLYALVSGSLYLGFLTTKVTNAVSFTYFVLESGIFFLIVLFSINHWTRRYQLLGGTYSLRIFVDIFIPTKNESAKMLTTTITAAKKINFANKRIYVIDDGDRPWLKALAERLDVFYLARPDRQTRAFKAATLNYALKQSAGSMILTLDADHVVAPQILDDLLGYFSDSTVALVSTRQRFHVSAGDFNHDHVFYEYMQAGKNADNSGISCGSGVIYRRAALTDIGGFQEWNIVEDLYTTYVLNAHGYKSIYVAQSYTIGDAPSDLAVIYKQRGTWAQDSLRLLFYRLPLAFRTQLTTPQFFHYFEMGYLYIVSGVVIPAVYLLNFFSLFTNIPIIHASAWYLLFKIPSFYFAIRLYDSLGQGRSSSQMWTALFPVYFLAIIKALLYKKQPYVVTAKKTKARTHIHLVLPQFATLIIGFGSILYHLVNYGFDVLLMINLFWLMVMVYWLYPVFPKALLAR